MAGPFDTLTAYMVRVPLVAVPLLLPALLAHLGIWDGWLLQLSPATGQMALMAGDFSWPLLGWQLAWIIGLWLLAQRAVVAPLRPVRIEAARRAAGRTRSSRGFSPWQAIRSFARTDRATLLRDPLVLMIVGGVPALAIAARLLATVGASWISDRFGVEIGPYLPVIWGLTLVLHTPLMFGSLVGLLFLEDRDARLLPVIATTRASIATLVAYRLGRTGARDRGDAAHRLCDRRCLASRRLDWPTGDGGRSLRAGAGAGPGNGRPLAEPRGRNGVDEGDRAALLPATGRLVHRPAMGGRLRDAAIDLEPVGALGRFTAGRPGCCIGRRGDLGWRIRPPRTAAGAPHGLTSRPAPRLEPDEDDHARQQERQRDAHRPMRPRAAHELPHGVAPRRPD